MMTAGFKTRSPIMAVMKMIPVSKPKWNVGVKLLNTNTLNPIHRITEEDIMPLAFVNMTLFTVAGMDIPLDLFSLKSLRKWMVSSVEIPRAMAAIKAVPVSKGIWKRPMMPKLIRMGKKLGSILRKPR